MRHAKSDWNADYGSDHDRPLNQRGVKTARLMGHVLSDRGLVPRRILSSTAVRAHSTADLAKVAGHWDCSLELDRSLYESGVDGVLAAAASSPNVEPLMIVGHQPTWSMLVARLTGSPIEMKTGSVAVIALEIDDWSELAGAEGELVELLEAAAYMKADS